MPITSTIILYRFTEFGQTQYILQILPLPSVTLRAPRSGAAVPEPVARVVCQAGLESEGFGLEEGPSVLPSAESEVFV